MEKVALFCFAVQKVLSTVAPCKELRAKSSQLSRQGQKCSNKALGNRYVEQRPCYMNSYLKTYFWLWKEAQDTEDLDLKSKRDSFGLQAGRYEMLLTAVFVSQKELNQEMVLPVLDVQRSNAVVTGVSYLKCN